MNLKNLWKNCLNKMKRNGASNSNGSNNSMDDGKEDEELAYLMEDIMPRNTLFEILGDVLNLSFNGVPLCRAQQRDEEEDESLRVKSSNREKRYAARAARGGSSPPRRAILGRAR